MPMPLRIFARRPRAPLADRSAEELEARRFAERDFVKAYDTAEADLWYIVDADWLAEWRSFMCNDGLLPGPIRNDRLVDSRGFPQQGLLRVVNYRGVNAAIWSFLQHRYGGGPALPRRHVDLYSEAVDDDSAESSTLLADTNSSSSPVKGALGRSGRIHGLTVPAVFRRSNRSRSGSLKPARVSRIAERCMLADGNSRSDEHDGCVFVVGEADAKVVEQPMDGSCLFHALCHGLKEKTNALLLRLEISKYIMEHPNMLVAGTPLAEWVRHDSGDAVSTYATKMAGNEWGGGIELEVAAHLKGVGVHVFEKCPAGYQRIATFNTGNLSAESVSVLYQGRNHYDALEFLGKSGEWVPRTQLLASMGGG